VWFRELILYHSLLTEKLMIRNQSYSGGKEIGLKLAVIYNYHATLTDRQTLASSEERTIA